MVKVLPPFSKAPLSSVMAPPTIRESELAFTVPPVTVKVAAAPELFVLSSVRLPAPALVSADEPEICPARVTALALVMRESADSAIALSMVTPLPVIVRSPPFSVTAPLPRLPSAAILNVPAVTEVFPM